MSRIVFTLLTASIVGAPSEALRAQDASDRDFRTASALLAEWETAWRSGDAEKTADLYQDGAVLVLPGGEWILGRDDIRTALADRILPAAGDVVLRPVDILTSGRMAVLSGRFWLQLGEDGFLYDRTGTFVVALFLDDGRWRIRSQVFSEEGSGF